MTDPFFDKGEMSTSIIMNLLEGLFSLSFSNNVFVLLGNRSFIGFGVNIPYMDIYITMYYFDNLNLKCYIDYTSLKLMYLQLKMVDSDLIRYESNSKYIQFYTKDKKYIFQFKLKQADILHVPLDTPNASFYNFYKHYLAIQKYNPICYDIEILDEKNPHGFLYAYTANHIIKTPFVVYNTSFEGKYRIPHIPPILFKPHVSYEEIDTDIYIINKKMIFYIRYGLFCYRSICVFDYKECLDEKGSQLILDMFDIKGKRKIIKELRNEFITA